MLLGDHSWWLSHLAGIQWLLTLPPLLLEGVTLPLLFLEGELCNFSHMMCRFKSSINSQRGSCHHMHLAFCEQDNS